MCVSVITATIVSGIFKVNSATVNVVQPVAKFMFMATDDVHDVVCISAYIEETVCKANVSSVGCHGVVSTFV